MMATMKMLMKMGRSYLGYKIVRPTPFFCLYVTTLRCNLQCKHCFVRSPYQDDEERKEYWSSLGDDLSTEQAKYAIDQLDRLGISALHLTGGEPLLRSDLEELALHAKRRGMFVSMDTNGTLVNKKRAESLCSLRCFDRIGVSLDGMEGTHDEIRGKNVFKKAARGIELLKDAGATVGVVFTINNINYDEVEDIYEFANAACDFITFLPVDSIKELFLDAQRAKAVGETLLRLKSKDKNFIENPEEYLRLMPHFLQGKTAVDCGVACHPFALYYTLGPSGDLSGCSDLSSYVGNILRDDIKEMHKRGLAMMNDVRRKCKGCTLTCAIQNSLLFQQPFYKAVMTAASKFLRRNA
ncbi:MAG: hypothetical protein DRN91_02095 [Candidatus Alkanophagales archaeon]|nr:MAG: hypothetical protein DRN91_02095 [Candidatus Alkanophagales archaeon]